MLLTNTFYAADLAAWRAWLQENHATCGEVWLICLKVHTGQPCIAYDDALDEALCYGWIDSIIQRIDAERYARKFNPRTNTANWSSANKKRVLRLMQEGRMQPEGLAVLPDKKVLNDLTPRPNLTITQLPELEEALKTNAAAAETWERLPPSQQRNYLGWISSAKRPETRAKRVAEALNLLAQGRSLGMK
ncbi:MAG: YdeI/OmpD-associated family protein [Chloroflexi bacterium]|nr:YdeI/OmpD-associated family protein [Chloroflexota bacterium]